MSLGYQVVELNLVNNSNSDEIPAGVYHCDMMDKNNITHYLYIGIYPDNEGIVTIIIYLHVPTAHVTMSSI